MALTALEIEAIFRLETGPVLQAFTKIAEEARLLEKELKRIAADTGAAFGAAFGTMGAGVGAQMQQVNALAAAWGNVTRQANLAAAAAGAHVPGVAPGVTAPRRTLAPGAGYGAGHGGGLGASIYAPGVPLPGGGHVHMHGRGVAMGAAVTAGGALFLKSEVEDIVSQTMFHLGKTDEATRETLRKDIEGGLSLGFPLHDVGEAVKDISRQFKFTPGGGLENIPEVLRASATEARLKGTSLKESTSSLIGLMHMTKEYDPDALSGKMAPYFSFLSTATPLTLPQISRAMSYAIPMLQSGSDVDVDEIMMAGVAMQRAQVTSTKSGTWLRSLGQRAVLGPEPDPSAKQAHARWAHKRQNLLDVGLIDPNDPENKPLWYDRPDHGSMMKLLELSGPKLREMPGYKRGPLIEEIFGERGGGAEALLTDPKVVAQMKAMKEDYPDFKGRYAGFMEQYSKESPIQLGRETWGELQNVLIDIGGTLLPAFVTGLRGLKNILEDLNKHLPTGAGPIVGGATVLGTVAGYMAGGPVGAVVGGVATTLAAKEAADNRVRGGGFLGAMTDLAKFMRWMMPGKAKADELEPGGPGPATFGERFGSLGNMFGTTGGRGPAGHFGGFGYVPGSRAPFNDRFGSWSSGASPPSPASIAPGAAIGDMSSTHQKAITVATNLNIDGRTLASIVSEHLVGGGDTSGGTYGPGNAQYSAS